MQLFEYVEAGTNRLLKIGERQMAPHPGSAITLNMQRYKVIRCAFINGLDVVYLRKEKNEAE